MHFSVMSEAEHSVCSVLQECVGMEPGWEDKGLCWFGLLLDKCSTCDTAFMED